MPVDSGMFSLLPLMSWGTKRWRKVSPISVGCCSLLHTAVWSQRDAVSDCLHYPKLNEIFHDQRRLKWCQPTADTPEDFKELQWVGDKIQFFLKLSTQLNHVEASSQESSQGYQYILRYIAQYAYRNLNFSLSFIRCSCLEFTVNILKTNVF